MVHINVVLNLTDLLELSKHVEC